MQNSIFQTEEWADFKCQTGWSKQHRLDDILVLEKELPLGRSMLYSPMVQNVERGTWNVERIVEEVTAIAKRQNAVFFRLEFDTPINVLNSSFQLENSRFTLHASRFIKAFEEMQPEHTLILDISKSESNILAQMKPKGRYNIKVAERSNIQVNWTSEVGPELDQFCSLYESMAKRQRVSHRSKKYFEPLLEILGKKGYARLYIAYTKKDNGQEANHKWTTNFPTTNNEQTDAASGFIGRSSLGRSLSIPDSRIPLAAAIVVFHADRATYLFGGSSNEHKNLMAPYRLHWQIIQDAKKAGLKEYDFFGIAPNDNPNHPWAGITRFKKQFGGQEVRLAGSWDLVFRPTEYQIFKIAEKIRR